MGTNISLGSLGTQTSALQAATDHLIQATHSTKGAAESAKIEKGAREFEAVLVGSWLQQAEQSFGSVPGGEDSQDVGKDSMMSFGVQTLATSMANSGGIGIGKMVAKAMHAAAAKEDGQNVIAVPSQTDREILPATLLHAKRIEEKR